MPPTILRMPYRQPGNHRVWPVLLLLALLLTGCAVDNAILSTLSGNVQRARGNYEQAILEYNHALTLNPNLPEAYYNRGLAHGFLDDYDHAIADFDLAIALKEDWAEAYQERARAYYGAGNPARALEDFDRALALQGDFVDAYIGRGRAHSRLNNQFQAFADFDRAVELSPEDPANYFSRGLILFATGLYTNAIQDFDQVIQLDPTFTDTRFWQGSDDSGLSSTYFHRGLSYLMMLDYEQALQDFDQVIQLYPTFVEAYFARGNIHIVLENTEQALADFTKVIELGLDTSDHFWSLQNAYFFRGFAYYGLGDYEQALQDLDKAIQLNPTDPMLLNIYALRGDIHKGLNNLEQAIADYSAAIELGAYYAARHSYAELYYIRGMTYFLADEIEPAIDDLTQSIELDPRNADFYYSRGLVFAQAEDPAQAIQDFGSAIELNGNHAEAHLMRARVYQTTLELELAIQDYERYLELVPDLWDSVMILAIIEKLKRGPDARFDLLTGNAEVPEATTATTTSVYTNPDFSWSVAYPSDWFLDATDTGFVRIRRGADDGLLGLCGIHSAALSFDSEADFVDYMVDHDARYFKNRAQTYDVLARQEITLASGASGIEVMVELGPGGKSRRVYFLTDDYAYGIDCETRVFDWPRLESTYDQIVNSFTLDTER